MLSQKSLFQRKTKRKTTWSIRFLILSLLLSVFIYNYSIWCKAVGWFLVCEFNDLQADTILIENFDDNYLLFEKAAELISQEKSKFAIVFVKANETNPDRLELVNKGFAEVMIRTSGIRNVELMPIEEIEPIAFNAALQVRKSLMERGNIKSVIIVTSGFRSKRTYMIYKHLFEKIGITASCLPVWGNRRPENWIFSWHGVQDVFLQYIKYFYYLILIQKDLFEQGEYNIEK